MSRRWTDCALTGTTSKTRSVAAIDVDYGVFDNGHSFSEERFEQFLIRNDIPWPRLESNRLELKSQVFRGMAKAYPIIAPLHELRHSLSSLNLNDLVVGEDGRNRTLLSPFKSKTARNQPGNAKFIFGPSVWLRGLIKPALGFAVAYIDYTNQEFAIAAALSGDPNMIAAYRSGDPYIAFGIQAGILPPGATKASHPEKRGLLKACVLGLLYGMGAKTLAFRIGRSELEARQLIQLHRETYRVFWKWINTVVSYAMIYNQTFTTLGWQLHIGPDFNSRSLLNNPMQAHGADILRVACCLTTERGIEVCAPVHDALLIAGPLDHIDDDVAVARSAMGEASRLVLGGFEIRTDVNVVRFPDRYMDERGTVMWAKTMELISQFEAGQGKVEIRKAK